MSQVFYRYLRAVRLNERQVSRQTLPRGGICFRFERAGDVYLPSWSICHPTDLFSKEVARLMADERHFLLHRAFQSPPLPDGIPVGADTDTITLAKDVLTWIELEVPKLEETTDVTFTSYLAGSLEILHHRTTELLTQHHAVNELLHSLHLSGTSSQVLHLYKAQS